MPRGSNVYPSKKAFKAICERDLNEAPLTFTDLGNVFGNEFWEMLVMTMMDANDAARAIQGAIGRLGGKDIKDAN